MNGLQNYGHVPMEIARAVLVVQEVGSLSKAAEVLGLSQPAISSQLKRLEALVGGAIFTKTPNGSLATELGLMVLQQCRKMLHGNDQLLAMGGVVGTDRFLRLGLSTLLTRAFLLAPDRTALASLQVSSDASPVLARRLLDGQLDMAGLLVANGTPPVELEPLVQRESTDELVWVRSRDFVLSPGCPIPVIPWSGENDPITRALEAKGISYRIAFSGGDFNGKRIAVEAGLGLTCLPSRQVPPELISADEYQLPQLSALKMLLCAGSNVSLRKAAPVFDRLVKLFFNASSDVPSEPHPAPPAVTA
jgi:DNA-binding transcriptional LysR family regulator